MARRVGYYSPPSRREPRARSRPARTPAARPARLGHRPLQLPLSLLHAGRDLRRPLRVPAQARAAQLRGDRAAGAPVRRARRREAAHHGRRAAACGPICRGSSASSRRFPGLRDLTLTTNGVLLERLAGPLADAGLRRITREPRQPRRGRLSPDERRARGSGRGARRHRGGAARGARADQAELCRPARCERCGHRRARAFVQGHRRRPALHRVHGRRDAQRLEPLAGRHGAGDPRADRCRAPARAGGAQLRRRGGEPLSLPRRQRRDRADLLRQPAVLWRLHARAPHHGRQARDVLVRDRRRRSARSAAHRRFRRRAARAHRRRLAPAQRSLLGRARREHRPRSGRTRPKLEMYQIGG